MSARFKVFQSMLESLGHPLSVNTRILDFGCGDGSLVTAAHEAGLDAYGCDIAFKAKWIKPQVLAELRATNHVRQIQATVDDEVSPGQGEPYRLPFDDATFDCIISDQVFEHVRNYKETLEELARILKPDGVMLHIFPSKYRLIEGHLNVPLATFFRPYWWLRLWATLGVRNQYQEEKTAREVAEENRGWLPRMTNYLTMRQIRREFGKYFEVRNVEGAFMAQSRAKVLLVPAIYRTLLSRCVFARRL